MSAIIEKMFGSGAPSVRAEDSTSGVEDTEGAANLEALRRQAQKGRNRSAKPSKSEQVIVDAQTQAALDELFENENWEEIGSMYFDIRYGITGYDGFLLSDKQKRILGKSMGTCMKLLLAIDPRYVALIVFTANFGAFISEKEYKWSWEKARRRAAAANAERG